MIELREWMRSVRFHAKPWLILGKGPTFNPELADRTSYNLMSLNHVVTRLKVDVAHIIDIDVAQDCSDALFSNCDWVLIPRHPHVRMRASLLRLEDFFDSVPVLRRLSDAGRLVWYNARSGPPEGESPVIQVSFFSSEAALSILGEMGAKQVRSLGVDGGRTYGSAFAHLADTTLLANQRPSFDVQFGELEKIAGRYGIDYRPLIEPLRIFVGAAERDLAAVRVLEFSIQEHASIPVRVQSLCGLHVPKPQKRENWPRTPFSFARFMIPELCGYRGRAVYVDSDMLVFGDAAELAQLPFDGAAVLCTRQDEIPDAWKDNPAFRPGRQFSVMVLDCEQLRWDAKEIVGGLDDGRHTYEDLMFGLCIVPPELIADAIPEAWNHLERFEPGHTKLLHYTVVPTQPWRTDDNPLGHLWMDAYRRAVAVGAVPRREMARLVARREVKRSLLQAFPDTTARNADGSPVELELDAARSVIDRYRAVPQRARIVAGWVRRALLAAGSDAKTARRDTR